MLLSMRDTKERGGSGMTVRQDSVLYTTTTPTTTTAGDGKEGGGGGTGNAMAKAMCSS